MPPQATAEPGTVMAAVLGGLRAGEPVATLVATAMPFHLRHNTFPAEVLFELAAGALDEAEASAARPIDLEHAIERHLDGDRFRSRQEQRLRLALHLPAAQRGGLRIDLLNETYSWQSDDLWEYALYSVVLHVRASADLMGVTVAELCNRLGRRFAVELTAAE